MVIPHQPAWAELSAEAKRERLLDAAHGVFSRDGLGAPMPAVAAAAGAGVGSVYRQFADKEDLVAALVLQRLAEFQQQVQAAAPSGDAWADFIRLIWLGVESEHGCDDLMIEAIAATSGRPDVSAARAAVADTIDHVMDRARVQGTLRPDAGVQDVRLLFAAVRGADRYAPGGGRRIAELLIAGLRAG